MQTRGIHHLAIKAHDPRALARFYASVLGLAELSVQVDERGTRAVWLRSATAILMFERAEAQDPAGRPTPAEAAPPGLHLLALAIAPEERPAWRRHLERHGVPVVDETRYTLYLRDPEGNRVGLSSWPNEAHEEDPSPR